MNAAPEPSGDAAQPPHLIELVAHIHAHWRAAAGIFGAIFGAALLIAALLPPSYTATATLAVLPAPEFTVREDAGSRAVSGNALAMDQIMKAETAILGSDELHVQAIKDVGLAELYPSLASGRKGALASRALRAIVHALLSPWRPSREATADSVMDVALQRFAGNLHVLPAKDANVISVGFSHPVPETAAATVNVMLADYAVRRSRLYDDPQLDAVRKEAQLAAQAAQQADAALASFKTAHLISNYAAERDMLLKRRSDQAQAFADLASAAAEQQARLAALNQLIARAPNTIPVYQEVDHDTRLQALDANLIDLRTRVAAARVHYRDASRLMTDLRAQLQSREADRERLARAPAPSVVRTGRAPSLDSLLLDRARAAVDLAASRGRVKVLRDQIMQVAAELARLDGAEAELSDLERRQMTTGENVSTANRLLAERRLTEAEDALRLANVRVIQPARVPSKPGPLPLLVVIAGFLFGGAASVVWLLTDFLARASFLTAGGLAYGTGLPVLGIFPARSRDYGEPPALAVSASTI